MDWTHYTMPTDRQRDTLIFTAGFIFFYHIYFVAFRIPDIKSLIYFFLYISCNKAYAMLFLSPACSVLKLKPLIMRSFTVYTMYYISLNKKQDLQLYTPSDFHYSGETHYVNFHIILRFILNTKKKSKNFSNKDNLRGVLTCLRVYIVWCMVSFSAGRMHDTRILTLQCAVNCYFSIPTFTFIKQII